ncbi:MAG: TRAP transporter small permease subunit [Sulfuricurvum sp.]
MMRTIGRLIGWSEKFAAFSLIVLVALVVYDALMRYLFQAGSVALQELEWHLFDIVILLSIGYTFSQDAHVRVDLFYEHFSEKTKALINLIGSVVFVLPFSCLIIYLGLDYVSMSFVQMEASADPGGLPYRFIIKSFIPLSFVLMVLQTFRVIVASWHTIQKGQ